MAMSEPVDPLAEILAFEIGVDTEVRRRLFEILEPHADNELLMDQFFAQFGMKVTRTDD